jgi:folate-binding protein YgfZ
MLEAPLPRRYNEIALEQDISTGYKALRTGAGIIDRSRLGRILLTGSDRRSYLQGLLTNDIAALTAGTGCYAALLTAQGRMIADMRVLELGDGVLLDVPPHVTDAVRAHLERFVFSEDVEVRDVTDERAEIGVYGPGAGAILSSVTKADLDRLPLFGSSQATFDGSALLVVRSDEAGVDGYDVIVDRAAADTLTGALTGAGAALVDEEAAEAVRIEAGRPRFGQDMNEDTIPLEAGIEDRAISRTKGCYVGQEVIIRVLDRGHGRVARRLVGLSLPPGAPVPAPGARIASGEREIGRVTSAVLSPALGRPIALGYVHRDFVSPGTDVTIGDTPAVVAATPFRATS